MRKLLILLTCATVLFSCGKKEEGGGGQIPPKPQNALFKEPILTFGASRETIKKQETRTLIEDTEEGLAYMDSDYGIAYLFENDKLIGSGILLPLTTDAKKLVDFLSSQYDIVGQEGDYFIWASTSRNLVIIVSVESYGILVTYAPYTKSVAPLKMFKIQSGQQADETTINKIIDNIRKELQ